MARFCPSGSFERMDYQVLFFTRAETSAHSNQNRFPQKKEICLWNSFIGASRPECVNEENGFVLMGPNPFQSSGSEPQ